MRWFGWLIGVAGVLGAETAMAQETAFERCVVSDRVLLDPAKPALTAQTLRIRDGRIAEIAAGRAVQGCATVDDVSGRVVLPGLIDAHVHLLGELGPNSRLEEVTKSGQELVVDGAANARKTLLAGFTTVVDLGGEPSAILALRDGVASGKLHGPRILTAGSAITPHGGHADVHGFRPDVMAAFDRANACSGADDCARAVREMVRKGVDVIKITATGGVLSNTKAGLGQQFTDAELERIIATAHSLGRKVAAHAHGKEGVDAALRAGVDSIEHGTYSDAESFKLYKSKNAALSPTTLAGATVVAQADSGWLTPAQRAKALQAGPQMLDMLRRARLAGVRIIYGTDTGVSKHGENAKEFPLWISAGFSPAEALRAATLGAAQHYGLEGEIGSLTVGKAADVIAVEGDPLQDITALQRVAYVMARGAVHKSPWTNP
jgi:imidazolonepropionase-like amidohydrolase